MGKHLDKIGQIKSNKMYILHVNTAKEWRGGERQTFYLVEECFKAGLNVKLLAFPNSPLYKEAKMIGLPVIGLKKGIKSLKELWPLVKNAKIIHIHKGGDLILFVILSCLLSRPIPIMYTKRIDNYPGDNIISHWKYKQVDKIICVSESTKQTMISYGIPEDRLKVIYSGVKKNSYANKERIEIIKDQLKIKESNLIVGYVGALDIKQKNLLFLLKAFQKAIEIIPRLHLVFCGEGKDRLKIKEYIKAQEMEEQVHLIGFQERVEEIYPLFNVLILPSNFEGFPTVLLNAALHEVPIIASNISGINEMVQDKVEGWLIKPNDEEELVKGLLKILNNPAMGKKMAKALKVKSEKKFTTKHMFEEYRKIYMSFN
ncbi:MAG: glycosyltransferase family 4 protein [bacterium]